MTSKMAGKAVCGGALKRKLAGQGFDIPMIAVGAARNESDCRRASLIVYVRIAVRSLGCREQAVRDWLEGTFGWRRERRKERVGRQISC